MKKNSLLSSLALASAFTQVHSGGIDDLVRKDTVIPMQHVKTTGPAMAGIQVNIQGKIHLLLVNPSDAPLFPDSLGGNIGNIQAKAKIAIEKMISNGKIPPGTTAKIQSYGTTTAVDIGEGKVGFLTASHVMQKDQTPNDVCITNRVIGESIPNEGVPILNISSNALNGKISYTQFPYYKKGQFMMIQIPSILRYEGMRKWIQGRFDKFIGGSSGAGVIAENPHKKGEFGIVSIFPGGTSKSDGSLPVAQMPRNEVINDVKALALSESEKGGDYLVCR